MNFTGKFKNSDEIEYVKYVLQLSGAREKEFVRAAILYYADFLMERAQELRQAEAQAIIERQQQAEAEHDSESTDPIADSSDPQPVEVISSDVLAGPEDIVANS